VTLANSSRPSTAAVAIALLIVYVVWGSTYLAIAVMIETLPPLLSAGVRYAVAGLLMLGALAAQARFRRGREPAERPTAIHWRSAFIIGSLLLLGGNGAVVLAELLIPSGIAAVLVATMPIWLAVFDALLSRRRPSGLVIGATISWAAGSLYARRAPLPSSQLLGTGMEMLAGGIVLFAAGSLLGEIGRTNVESFSIRSLVAVAYLTVFGSIIAFTAYTWLLANVPVSTVGTYAYVNPIVAVALGAVILSEPITPRTLIATAIIIGAVVAMVSGRPREAEEAGPVPEAAGLERG